MCLRGEEVEGDVLLGQGVGGWDGDVDVVLVWWELQGWVSYYLEV